MNKKKLIGSLLAVAIVLLASFFGLTDSPSETAGTPSAGYDSGAVGVLPSQSGKILDPDCAEEPTLDPDGAYTAKEDVALYIHLYGCLPGNFMTKEEARDLGWEGGGLEDFAPGMCIGGDRFGNYEGLLPDADGRTWTECDIDTLGADSRGAKRIVFSNDGLIYYTDDHYENFELLYGDPQ